jgi:hypothetical protein
MCLHVRFAPVGFAVAILLVLAAASASARNLSVNEQRFSIRWTSLELIAGVGTVRCPVTMSGSFHSRTFTKSAGLLVKAMIGTTINNAACTGGRYTVLAPPPSSAWAVRYASFAGTLPSPQSARFHLVGLSAQFEIGGQTCLLRTDVTEPFVYDVVIGASGEARTVDVDQNSEIDLEDEDFLCAIAGDLGYNGNGAVDGSVVEPIVVRLIT